MKNVENSKSFLDTKNNFLLYETLKLGKKDSSNWYNLKKILFVNCGKVIKKNELI